jgi:hypothetical protein
MGLSVIDDGDDLQALRAADAPEADIDLRC